MTARDRWRRAYGYARACKRWAEAWAKAHAECPAPLGVAAGGAAYEAASQYRRAATATLRQREAHAWARLPESARQALQNPAP